MSDFEQIEVGTISVAASSLSITSIPSTYTHLELTFNVHCTQDSRSLNCFVQLNGDTGSKYGSAQLYSFNGDNWAFRNQYTGTGYNVQYPFEAPGLYGTGSGNRDTNHTSTTVFRFFNYAGTTLNKLFTAWCASPFGVAHGNNDGCAQEIGVYTFDSTAAINQITLLPEAGNFDTGAKYMLAGYK